MVGGGTTNYIANLLNQYDNVGSVYYDSDLNGNTNPFGYVQGMLLTASPSTPTIPKTATWISWREGPVFGSICVVPFFEVCQDSMIWAGAIGVVGNFS